MTRDSFRHDQKAWEAEMERRERETWRIILDRKKKKDDHR